MSSKRNTFVASLKLLTSENQPKNVANFGNTSPMACFSNNTLAGTGLSPRRPRIVRCSQHFMVSRNPVKWSCETARWKGWGVGTFNEILKPFKKWMIQTEWDQICAPKLVALSQSSWFSLKYGNLRKDKNTWFDKEFLTNGCGLTHHGKPNRWRVALFRPESKQHEKTHTQWL